MTDAGRLRRRSRTDLGSIIKLLGQLSQRGAGLDIRASADGTVAVIVMATGGRANVVGQVAGDVAAEAQAAGWIAPTADGQWLRLTDKGCEALRQIRSRRVQAKATMKVGGSKNFGASKPTVNHEESPLAWLRSRRDAKGQPMVDDAQFAAGERLRAEFTFAHLTPRVTMAWSGLAMSGGAGGGGARLAQDLADHVLAARLRVTAALKAVGPEHADILIDVCGHLKGLEVIARSEGWPGRAVKVLLQRALTALARHYGLIAPVAAERRIAERLRHWGAEDYRPSLSRWEKPDQAG